jgi:2-polyprenyl-6-methoxyphenol hydroxylase-like FAD-dependent oxidoreductase
MATATIPEEKLAGPELIDPAQETSCCVVGAGPGGMMLALLLARAGVKVTLLEAHKDFDREFRGDTLHPSILEILDQMGLAERLHQLPHNKIYGPTFQSSGMSFSPIDFRRLKTKFPYIMLLPQTKFLEFLAAEGKKYPNFRLRMVANVGQLIESEHGVEGVRYRSTAGWHEVRAPLTIGADGRFSKVRQLAGFEPVKTSPPMDILWFQLPHLPGDEHSDRVMGGFGNGRLLAVFDRIDYWQIGYVFPKGQYQQVRAAGLEAFRKSIVEIEPVSVEKSQFTTHLFVPASLLVIHFLCFSRPGSCSCNLRGWLTAEESHQAFQVLRRGRQIELFAYEAHPAQPQSA